MKTYRLTLSVAAVIATASIIAPAQAQQANDQNPAAVAAEQHLQLQQLQAQATGASFEVADSQFRVVPNARVVEQSGSNAGKPGSDLLVSGYQVQLQATNSRQKRSLHGNGQPGDSTSPATEKQVLVVSEGGTPAVLTSTMLVFFNDPAALQQAAKAAGGKVGYASTAAGMGSIEFNNVDLMLQALPRVLGQAGIRGAEPELIQSTPQAH